jgi:CSLREA domain-containing protein
MKSKIITAVLCFGVLLFGAITAQAATLTVTKIADTNDNVCDLDCSLREAIFAATSDDTIEFAAPLFYSAQTITLALGQLGIDKNLTISGRGTSLTAISGNNASRVFQVASTGNLTLNNLTVTGGRDGGSGNKYGGGVINFGTLTINNSVFSGNTVAGSDISYGGAIYNDDNSSMTITRSSISGNALAGFALNVNCRGGGIYNAANTTVVITDSTISNNTGNPFRDNAGIGIYNQGGTMTITGSTISGNTVSNASANTNHAGGIYNTGNITLLNSTISGNTVISGNFSSGGGIYNGGTVTIINSTVTRNTASSTFSRQGGGIANLGGTINAVNTIISGNTSPRDPDLFGSLAVNTNNYIGGDAKLVLLGSNGGTTQTHALLSDSPAINAGNSCVLTANACGFTHPALTTDQRGATFPRLFGTAVDVGAVEDSIIISPTTLPPGTKNVAYNQTLTATGGGSLTYTFTLDSGTLPTGFTLTSGGLLSGTTTQEGTFNFAVRATGTNGLFIVKNYVLLIGNYVTNTNSSGAGSLRQIIADVAAGSTIRFDPVFFGTTRTIALGGTVLTVNKNLTIIGPGSGLLTIDGENSTRVLNVDSPAVLTLNGVRIIRGNGSGSVGGCVLNNATFNATDLIVENCSSTSTGGGIFNAGPMTLTSSTISRNTAVGSAGIFNNTGQTANVNYTTISNNTATNGGGGGIGNAGTVNVLGSTFVGNSALFGGAATAGAVMIINNSTISGNTATTNKAGAVYIGTSDRLDTTNTTITNNVSNGNLTGGIYSDGGAYNTRNSIIAGNRNGGGGGSPDIAALITSYGYNLIGSTAGNSFAAGSPNLTGNLTNVSANLAPLSNYGGSLQTHALLSNSPAINASDPSNTYNVDQRGSLRPVGGRGDIGSVERNIVFNQTTLPNAVQNSAYNQTLTINRLTSLVGDEQSSPDNFAPFTFSIVSIAGQSLPNGLTMSSAGIISGTPTTAGSFTFTIRATDTDGIVGVQQYTITVTNTPPTITASGITLVQSSPVSNSTIATVGDIQSGASGVTVTITSANPSNGVTISNIVNTNGTITANAVAACGATNANFTLTATDGGGLTATATLNVTITANTAPNLAYSPTFNVSSGGSLNVTPTTANDNGTVTYSIFSVSPAMTTAPTVNSSGVVSITNANPLGNHTITVRATDACNLTTNASFTLIVEPPIRTVTKIDDTNDGVCDADCSLREAIATAVSGDTINFAALLFNTAQTIILASELNVAGKSITITGKGANLTAISGNNLNRVFNVAIGGNLTLDGLTVTNGRNFDTGGGIYNGGTLTVINSTVSNSAVNGGSDNFGGGIYNGSQATLIIRGSTISGNSVSGSGNFSNRGGGIANVNGTLTITNSTVSGNLLGGGTNNRGGGIYSEYGTLTILNDTITNNVIGSGSFSYGGGLAISVDTVSLVNTIISGNSASQNPDLLGSVNENFNFIGGDAGLSPLGFYGGTTQTHALLSNSPVINAGNNCVLTANACGNNNSALSTDQRSSQRSIGELVDMGSFEANVTFNQATLPNGNTTVNYSQQLSATRQTSFVEEGFVSDSQNFAPATFEVVLIGGQSLPPGITLSSGGLLSGMPTTGGTYNFTVKATDTDGIAGAKQYSIQVLAPTAATVLVSGRVFNPYGRSLKNARVQLTDSNGNSQTVMTGQFGYFRFLDVAAGETYVVTVFSKQYRYSPRVISINEDITDLVFSPEVTPKE